MYCFTRVEGRQSPLLAILTAWVCDPPLSPVPGPEGSGPGFSFGYVIFWGVVRVLYIYVAPVGGCLENERAFCGPRLKDFAIVFVAAYAVN